VASDSRAEAGAPPRRNYFRLRLYDVDCQFQRDGAAEPGELIDIGGGGARFTVCNGDWSVRDDNPGKLCFRLSDADFEFPCRLIRKTDDGSRLEYVAEWFRPRQSEVDRLVQAIYRVELARPRVKPRAVDKAARRKESLRRRLFIGFTAGAAVAGLVFLLGRGYALPAWASITCASALLAALEG